MTTIRTALAVTFLAGLAVLASPAAHAQTDAQDEAWLVAAHQGNLAEIAAGQAAVAQASSDEVRELGQMLVDDHTRLDADLAPVAEQLDVTLPSTPTSEQRTSLAALQAITSDEFDEKWVSAQIADHRATLASGKAEVADGQEATVIALASAAGPVVEHHLHALLAVDGEPDSHNGGDTGGGTSLPYILGIVAVIAVVAGLAYLLWRRRHGSSEPVG